MKCATLTIQEYILLIFHYIRYSTHLVQLKILINNYILAEPCSKMGTFTVSPIAATQQLFMRVTWQRDNKSDGKTIEREFCESLFNLGFYIKWQKWVKNETRGKFSK